MLYALYLVYLIICIVVCKEVQVVSVCIEEPVIIFNMIFFGISVSNGLGDSPRGSFDDFCNLGCKHPL